MDNLLKIEDIAVEKANKYGMTMIEKIKSFCQDRGAKMDVLPSDMTIASKVNHMLFHVYSLRCCQLCGK